jgi:Fic family protein
MKIPQKYQLNPTITLLLQKIEKLKTQIEMHTNNKHLEKIVHTKSLLKSAVYSARIEGNLKTINEVSVSSIKNAKDKENIELENLYKALEFVTSESWGKNLTLDDIKTIHSLVMAGLSAQAGSLRTERSTVNNQAGIVVYLCPPPSKLTKLLENWLLYVNDKNDPFIPIKVALAHYSFEKIHPFTDGNGRVGRLLVHLVMKKWLYDFKGLLAFEEFLNNRRSDYYDLLNLQHSDITPFVEFFLEGFAKSLDKTLKQLSQPERKAEQLLLPRRLEILETIRDHRQVSFDFIKRRFYAVSDRLLRYDLKKLQDAGFILKRGVTKGCVYEPIQVLTIY